MLDEEQRMRKDARGKTRFHSCRGGTCYHQVSLPPQQRFLYQTILDSLGQKSKCECTAIYKPCEIKKSGQKSFCSEIVKRRNECFLMMVKIFKDKDEGKTYCDSRPRSPWHSCRSRCPPCPCTGPLCSTPPTSHRLPCTLRC